jgi:hypothetical protein
MTRPRLTIAQLMTLILLVGFGTAALHNANQFWASATYTIAIISILAALLFAFANTGKARMTGAGFAVFGWAYLLIGLLPDRSVGSLGSGPVPWPSLIIERGTACLQPYIHPLPPPAPEWFQYEQVSHSLGIILFGLVGALIGGLVAPGRTDRITNWSSDCARTDPVTGAQSVLRE